MFKQMVKELGTDTDYPPRTILIDMYIRVYEGRLYDHLQYPFCQEYDGQNNYIPLRNRQPSVRYNICKMVVDDSVSLTFGSDHFPAVICDDKEVQDFVCKLINQTKLALRMIECATYGSVGSIALLMRILKGKVFWEVKTTQYLTPFYNPEDPESLLRVFEKYKVPGKALKELGYKIEDEDKTYWFMREWTDTQEIFYIPWKIEDKEAKPRIDKKRTVTHNLGFVPVIWGKNLPKPGIDGACTFEPAIDTNIEIDYQLSQGGRGLKYSSDPMTILKLDDSIGFEQNNAVGVAETQTMLADGSMAQIQGFPQGAVTKKVVKGANNSLVVGQDDEVELLEITGKAAEAVCEYVRFLREIGIESMHGNRSNADRVNAAQSGKAMQAMNQALIWLADKFRTSYGDLVLLPAIEMVIKASNAGYGIILGDTTYKNISIKKKCALKWPDWYPRSADERLTDVQAAVQASDGGILSKETALKNLADEYGVKDTDAELKLIEVDRKKLIQELQPQTKENISA